MKQLKLVSILSIVCLSTACDPTKFIIVKNKTNKPAYFRWTIRTDSVTQDLSSGWGYKNVTFDLGTSKSDRKKMIVFGFGGWPTREVERFVQDIQSVEIETADRKIQMTDRNEIKNFLLERRHGILKNFITIKIK